MKARRINLPKVRRAQGNSSQPITVTIDARTRSSFEEDVQRAQEERKKDEEEKSVRGLVPGSFAFLKCDMASHGSPRFKTPHPQLIPGAGYGAIDAYPKGSTVIFIECVRYQIVDKKLGPMRVMDHVWMTSDGKKFIIAVKFITKEFSSSEKM